MIGLTMNFNGFTISPSYARKNTAPPTDEELRTVGEILEQSGLMNQLPTHAFLRVELGLPAAPGDSAFRAHGWSEGLAEGMGTLEGFPRQPPGAVCPSGIVQVSVDCVVESLPACYYGFAGYYLNLLVSIPERRVWDARGESTP